MKILDIGANVGRFAESYYEKYKNDLEIVMVEANPNLIQGLKGKFANLKSSIVLNNCVSNVNDQMVDFYLAKCEDISTANKKWITESRFNCSEYFEPIKVKSITIEKLIESYGDFDLIKIDVEGYEHVVISGIEKYHGLISFEWAEESYNDIIDSIKHLNSIGYNNFHISLTDSYLYVPNEYVDFKTILKTIENDLVAERKEKWGMIFAK